MKQYAGQLQGEKFKIRKVRNHHDKKKNKVFCDDIFTFDIETTSAWINEDGKIIRYHPGRSGDYWNNLQAVSLCYIWQFGYNNTVYYGRELTDFRQVLEDLPQDAHCIVWVHNLSWEMHFLQNIFDKMELFARMPHKPMKLVPADFPNIEFRCSYMLTRLSLDAWGKSLGVNKLTGTINYNRIRTPKTKLSGNILKYSEQDCIVVYHGIKEYLKRYETPDKIPLTQTGTVRQDVKKMLLKDPEYHKWIKKLVPHSAKEYSILQSVFAGGYTHANRLHAGMIVEASENPDGVIEHYDFASHYPTQMVARKYPSTPWAYLGHHMPKTVDYENFAYIFHLRFTRIRAKTYNTYIQDVKSACLPCPYAWLPECRDCRKKGKNKCEHCEHKEDADRINEKCNRCRWSRPRKDNGRVISAYQLEIWVTEQDLLTIQETYEYDKMETLDVYRSRKQYLPTKFVDYILQLYANKTTLKGVTEEEQPGAPDLYAQSKQYINSLFGMSVTALCMADVLYDQDTKQWDIDTLTEDDVNATLSEMRSWNPRERRYFLNFSWGCWITAYARRALWVCLQGDNRESERNVLYCDTDSLFIIGHGDFTNYNKWIVEQLDAAMDYHGFDPDRTRPKDPHGKRRQLGIFEKEDDCEAFITLGAKRYLERRMDGKLYLTVSGVNKEAVKCLHGEMENFADGFIFDKDQPAVKKSLHTYIYDQPPITWPDGYQSTAKYGINLRPNGYHLHMTDEYKRLINYAYKFDPTTLPDSFKTHLRGRFTTT